jgi:hypothetical protein
MGILKAVCKHARTSRTNSRIKVYYMASVGRVIDIPHFLTAGAVQKQRDDEAAYMNDGQWPRSSLCVGCRHSLPGTLKNQTKAMSGVDWSHDRRVWFVR